MAGEDLEKREYPAGTVIFREGDPGTEMFIVESGRVRIWRGADQNNVLGVVDKKGIFGEMALINDKPRTASATADVDTVCSVVSKSMFQERLGQVNTFVKTLIKLLAVNIHSLNEYVEKHEKS